MSEESIGGSVPNFHCRVLGLGAEAKDLTFLQCSIRGIIVFLCALLMVRIGSKRALAEKTAIDTLTIVIVASVLSRSINGPFAIL